jgi:predicted ATPase
MKRLLSLVICIALVMTMFTACGAKGVKTGLAVVSSAGSSKEATEEKDGTAQVDSTAVAVLVDDKGVIKNIVIDVVQTKFNFSATGEITTDLGKTFDSKKELGDAYDMRKASNIKKEWFEQAKALEEYVTGKTLSEVKGIAIEDGYPTSEDLTSSVTMKIDSMILAIEKAVNNAKDLGAKAGDQLGLGITSGSGSKTANATAENDGTVQAYSHYSAVSFDKSGKITSSIIDASQTNVTFSTEGKLTSNLNGDFKTKLELGDAYDMRKASNIKKEWFEQSEAFCEYVKGKTVSDVKGIALSEGYPADEDLLSSVTMHITDFVTVIEEAGAVKK